MFQESQGRRFCQTEESACGSQEDLTKLITCRKIIGALLLQQKEAPAAAETTSPSILHGNNTFYWMCVHM